MAGRPLKFETVEQLQKAIDSYFEYCDNTDEPYMITGLALHLDTSRNVLMDYEGKDAYSNTIKKAKLRVEKAYEQRLVEKARSGDIFALKNFGWVDKVVTENTNTNTNIDLTKADAETLGKLEKLSEDSKG